MAMAMAIYIYNVLHGSVWRMNCSKIHVKHTVEEVCSCIFSCLWALPLLFIKKRGNYNKNKLYYTLITYYIKFNEL